MNSKNQLTVESMMNRNFQSLKLTDSLRTVVEYYHAYKVTTLPVVDEAGKLAGVFPRKRLFRALLDGFSLEEPCHRFMVTDPVFVTLDRTYDEYSLVVRVTKSKVDNVVVLDKAGNVAGIIGTAEYLKASLDMILSASALLESVFMVNYEGILITDKDGEVLRLNPAAEKILGQPAAKVKGAALTDLIPELDLAPARQLGMRRVIGGLTVIVNLIPITEGEQVLGYSAALLDISDLEKITQELEVVKNLQTTISGVLNASSDGVFVSDTSGRISYLNEPACSLVSKDCKDLIGRNIQELFTCSAPEKILESGVPEVDTCDFFGKQVIVSHVPYRDSADSEKASGMVSTAYLNDNSLTEEIARKWLSLNQQLQYYREELEKRTGSQSRFDQMVSHNKTFQEIKKEARRIARSTSTVLLTGESGVGKDMFARGLHEASPRAGGPFIKVNCVSIPETLFESELFGYAPGSFTGALKSGKPGYFERADGGTIFLDEIGDMPMSVQVKLLQVIQEKEFTRVGGTRKQQVDVRIIAATNRDLREAIAEKTFREDLFYRLNVIEFHLPPLRERHEDILPLAWSFIEKYNQVLGSSVTGIQDAAAALLTAYPWPGNIRELENAVERAANYGWEGQISPDDLPAQIRHYKVDGLPEEEYWDFAPGEPTGAGESAPERPATFHEERMEQEKNLLLKALEQAGGNRSAAARLMNLSRSAFYERLARHGIK